MPNLRHYWIGFIPGSTAVGLFGIALAANCWFGWRDFFVSALLQTAGVFLALTLAYIFFEHRSYEREERVKKTISLFTDRLRLMATEAVVSCAEQVLMEPEELAQVDSSPGNKRYEKARELTISKRLEQGEYGNTPMTYEILRNIFDRFKVLGGFSGTSLKRIGASLNEFGYLMRAMINLERTIEQELKLWNDFGEKNGSAAFVPRLAKRNLVSLSQMAIELVDIIDRANFEDSPRTLNGRRYFPLGVAYDGDWGEDLV